MTAPHSPRLAAALERLNARIDWERKGRRDAMRVDVGPARDLLQRLGRPQDDWRAVHVGGTKGKGSVAALVGAGLRAAGLRVGVYSSPHVERVTERVRIDGQEVADELFGESLEAVLEMRDRAEAEGTPAARATWFDLVTAAAFRCFARAECDWGVIEVGLGGRLDSTNVLDADVSIITSIDLEHTEVLGSTRAAIAAEKAGIVRAHQDFVTSVAPTPERGPDEDAGTVLASQAQRVGAAYHLVRSPEGAKPPTLLERNVALAAAALDRLGARGHRGPGVSGSGARRLSRSLLTPAVVASAALPGRLERRSLGRVPVVLDGAHVASSVTAVLDELAAAPDLRGFPQVVLGLGRDKDAGAILKALSGRVDRVHCTSVASGLALPAVELARLARELGHVSSRVSEPEAAVAGACAAASPEGWVLVIGSLHLVGAVRGGLDPAGAR